MIWCSSSTAACPLYPWMKPSPVFMIRLSPSVKLRCAFGFLCLLKNFFPLALEPLVLFFHPLVPHLFVFRGVRFQLRAVDRHVPDLHHFFLLTQPQNPHKQPRQHLQMHSTKLADPCVI